MELWHVLNRGTEKRKIFMDDRDRARFVYDLCEFNDTRPANNMRRSFEKTKRGRRLVSRDAIVDIHAWCLMDNHYHLLVSQRSEGGLTTFLRKLNTGYTNYFNERYDRSGVLFQGKTKRRLVDSDAHFLHVLHYIHLNPLDRSKATGDWRSGRIQGRARAVAILGNYKWSSYRDCCGQPNFPSVISTELYRDAYKDYGAAIDSYLRDIDTNAISETQLE
jgi:putative transposase